MEFKVLLTAVSLLATTHASFAKEYEKNGLPCVAEICIGDGLSELSKVKWDRATVPFSLNGKTQYLDTVKPNDSSVKNVQARYKGNSIQITQFLMAAKFDNGSLAALSGVNAQCGRTLETGGLGFGIEGTFTSQSGNPTTVEVALMPDTVDTSKQAWQVVSIKRSFPAAISKEQISDVKTQLIERYGNFTEKYRKFKSPKLGEGQFFINEGITTPFYMSLKLYSGNDLDNRMRLHPACGGSAKVKLD